MPFLAVLAETFQVTQFDVVLFWGIVLGTFILYYFVSLHQIFEAAFGSIVGLGIYILLSVILIGNPSLGTSGWIFPLWFSVFLVSISVYLVFILAILFPLHGWLIINEPIQPALYTILYMLVGIFLFFSLAAVMLYMTEQSYVFHVGNIFTWFREGDFYKEIVRKSWYYGFVMSRQNIIIPLWVILMIYKILLSNIVNAALLSIWYNLANVGFYRQKNDAHYRVEFHEVGWWHGAGHDSQGHDDSHGWWHGHEDHGWHGHDTHH